MQQANFYWPALTEPMEFRPACSRTYAVRKHTPDDLFAWLSQKKASPISEKAFGTLHFLPGSPLGAMLG
jgi:hypothetical protein